MLSNGRQWSHTLSTGNHVPHSLYAAVVSLSDEAMENALYEIASMRQFAHLSLDKAIPERPGNVRVLKKHPRKNKTAIKIEYLKASIRAKVEHPFRIIKCQFGFIKARYKGLMKNDSQLAMLFTLANLFKVDQLLRRQPRSA